MFLAMALIVCFASVFIEIKLVNSWPFLEKIYTQGIFGIPGAWVNNICSLAISAVFGMVFQAQGIAIFVGGMLSIPMSNMYFGAKYKLNERGITLASLKSDYGSRTAEVEEWFQANKGYVTDFVRTTWILVKIVGWPLRAILKANSKMLSSRERIHEFQENARLQYEAVKHSLVD